MYAQVNDETIADFYVLVGNYLSTREQINIEKGLSIKAIDYSPIILIYTADDMKEELSKIRLKTKDEKDNFFGFRFRDEEGIVLHRGFVEGYNTLNDGKRDRKSFVLKNKLKRLSDS